MKAKVLCNDNPRFAAIKRVVIENDPDAEVSGGVWRIEDLPTFIDGVGPDLLIVDDAVVASLGPIEQVLQRHPAIDVLLLSGEDSSAFLRQAMRIGVREVIPAPVSDEALGEALGRVMFKHRQEASTRGEGQVYAFISSKGGSGATFLASNLAYALAREQGKRVALVDLNLQFGDAVMFVSDRRCPSNVAEVAREVRRLDASFLEAAMLEVAPGFHVLASPDDPAHSADVKREHVEAIIRLARRHYDAVIVDVARTLDVVSLQALDMADLIFMVSQLTLPFVRDSKRLVEVFRSLGYPSDRVRLIVNRYSRGGEISLTDMERTVGLPVFKAVPNSYAAAASSVNLGIPILQSQRHDPISTALVDMARILMPGASLVKEGLFSRLFARGR